MIVWILLVQVLPNKESLVKIRYFYGIKL